MHFKNLMLYRLPEGWAMTVERLEESLARRRFTAAGSQDLAARGFVPPSPASGELVFASNRQWLIALRTEQKILPASVITQFAEYRVEEVIALQGFRPGRKQMKEIREDVTQELLPRAFSRLSTTLAWIDPLAGWLVVDAASCARADELIETLREVLDELPLRLVETQISPSSAMADWLAGNEAPAGFTIDRDCELRSVTEEKATVRYVHHPLEGDDIPKHLADGKVPTKLGLTFDERISFVLTDRLEVKRLAFLDVIQEEAEKAAGGSSEEQFEADFVLMTAELARFLPRLIDALGGPRREEAGDMVDKVEAETDELYEKAVMVVMSKGHPSISLVQRHLQIGYNRAARLIEEMERRGVVSPMRGDGARALLKVAA